MDNIITLQAHIFLLKTGLEEGSFWSRLAPSEVLFSIICQPDKDPYFFSKVQDVVLLKSRITTTTTLKCTTDTFICWEDEDTYKIFGITFLTETDTLDFKVSFWKTQKMLHCRKTPERPGTVVVQGDASKVQKHIPQQLNLSLQQLSLQQQQQQLSLQQQLTLQHQLSQQQFNFLPLVQQQDYQQRCKQPNYQAPLQPILQHEEYQKRQLELQYQQQQHYMRQQKFQKHLDYLQQQQYLPQQRHETEFRAQNIHNFESVRNVASINQTQGQGQNQNQGQAGILPNQISNTSKTQSMNGVQRPEDINPSATQDSFQYDKWCEEVQLIQDSNQCFLNSFEEMRGRLEECKKSQFWQQLSEGSDREVPRLEERSDRIQRLLQESKEQKEKLVKLEKDHKELILMLNNQPKKSHKGNIYQNEGSIPLKGKPMVSDVQPPSQNNVVICESLKDVLVSMEGFLQIYDRVKDVVSKIDLQ